MTYKSVVFYVFVPRIQINLELRLPEKTLFLALKSETSLTIHS